MRNAYLVAAAAGFASALGLLLAAFALPPLLLLAGVPVFAVGLIWGYAAALLGAASGTLLLAFAPGDARLAMAFFIGLPAVFLTYLAGVEWLRNAGPNLASALSAQTGRIVLGAAIFGGLFSALMMVGVHEGSLDAFRQDVGKAIEESYQYTGQPAPSASEISATTDSVLRYLPASLALFATTMALSNLWIAGRLVFAAQLLRQPWPDLASFRLPAGTPVVLAVSLVSALTLSDSAGLIATSVTSAMLVVYLLLGLAVIHFITRTKRWRGAALLGVYIGLLWLAVPIILLGLVDTVFPLRRPPAAGNGTT